MVSLLAPKDPIQALLACTGPILFNSPIDGRASADGYYPISRDDLTREYFEHSWRARKDDETFGDPLVRAMTLALSRDATFFRVDDLKLALSMDDTSSPLIFSAKSYFINQAFHSTGGEAGGQSGFDPREAPSEEWMKLSGIDRFPGCVVLALDGRTSGDGGIKTLADMFSLAGLSASPWLQPLLSNTNVTLTKPGAGTPRNAMWFLPGNEFTSCFRLEGSVDLKTSFGGFIQKYLSSWEDKIPAMPVVAKRTVVPAFNTVEKYYDNVGELTLGVELDVGVTRGLGVYASIMEDCVTFMLVSYSPAVGWAALKDWLKKNCEGIMGSFSKLEEDLTSLSTGRKQAASATDDPGSQQQPSTDSNLNGIFWRKLSVTISDEGIHAASIDLEASIPFLVPQGKHAVFNLSFTWEPGMYEFHCSFAGQPPSPSKRVPIQYHFDYERWTHLTPLVKSEPVMSLKYLDPSNELTIPHGVPSEISSLDLSISNTALHFSTQLQSALPPPSPLNADASTLPILRLDRVFLSLDATIDYSSPQTKFSVLLDGTVALKTRYRSDPPFYLAAFIGYTSSPSSWSFRATAANLPMAALYSLFVGGAEQSAVVNMLRAIQLRELSLGYEFTSGAASEVRFEALMGVAGLETAVTFCRSSKTEWSFSATLLPQEAREEEERKMMLGGAVRDLLGEGVVGLLPEVVQGTELLFSGSSERDRFGVVCTRHNDPPRLVFGAELCFGAVQLHFAQVADVTERKATTDAEGKTVKPPSPMVKRVVRVALGLPSIGREFPLIGKLDLPCDEVEFVWASKDVTAEDLNTINAKVDFLTRHPIVMREGDDVLAKGLHFRLLDHGHVLIDHAFSESKAATTETPAPAAGGESGKERDKPAPVTPARGGTEARGKTAPATEAATMAPLKKQKGGLKISGIGLSFDAGVLEIHLDARVSIGPIEAGIRGLAVIFNLSKARGLHDLLKCDVDVRIDGFDMAFDRPPVMLAGALYHARSAQAEVYNGGVAISLRKFSIAALGQYAQVAAKHPDPAYDSFFVYARMEGTLFTVGWAEITGLIAAFGYNSRLRLPDMDSLPSYPFLSGFNSPGGYSLEHTLSSLTGPAGWVTPSMGSLWLAAGVLMRACQTLDIQAVATLALGPDQGEVGLLARAQACLPRGSKPDDALMLIDLSLMGKLDFLHGEFSVQGAIIPTSFILNKNCRPSGEFAVKSWFGDNPHAGDWVVSFGGYHPSFRRPDHYPNPARLRISWAISSNLSVTGEAYAAVTPGAIMAGALLHACFQLGGLTAWFDAHADFLINLKPLHYEAEVAVSAGISYEIRVWFIRTKISVELGATLSLAGPPLGGTVHFDVAIFSFDVHFGDSTRGQPPALGLADFLDLVLTEFAPAESTTKNSPASIKDMYNKAHTLSLTSGRVVDAGGPSPSEADGPPSSSDPWTVRSNDFHFQVRSPVPITTASITSPSPTTPPATSAVNISSRPMHLPSTQSLTSTFSVSVRRTNDINSTESLPFRLAAPLWSPLPSNHWGAYSPTPDSYLDPARSAPTVTHLVGLSVLPPEPKAAESSLPVSATAVAGEPHSTLHVVPLPAPTGTGRYLGRKGEKVKAKLQWERVKAAMEPGGAMIERGEVLREFLEFVVPVTEQERKDGFVGVMGEGPETGVWKAMGERETVRSGFRRIGAGKPRVVLQEPRRFYRCPPMVFCG
ncbi:hypothetical protein C8A05DRAFT_18020 [Staphylotrichum tortipilum]|uniref:DUF6603 domain-containing protein n=1 Tax=Staphylotrichum tortipilum TaxID=2831512 RepID=A0AAN6MG86_9PEZI|nr:hypothetical protein C8A05DRAFT_18020 [Staphylotrichum longicolle]